MARGSIPHARSVQRGAPEPPEKRDHCLSAGDYSRESNIHVSQLRGSQPLLATDRSPLLWSSTSHPHVILPVSSISPCCPDLALGLPRKTPLPFSPPRSCLPPSSHPLLECSSSSQTRVFPVLLHPSPLNVLASSPLAISAHTTRRHPLVSLAFLPSLPPRLPPSFQTPSTPQTRYS
jgi:hypothetical protein